MKKRDKTKAYKMNIPKEVMPRRKENKTYELLYNITRDKLNSTIQEVFRSKPPIHSHWHDDMLAMQPKTPTESFGFKIMDFGSEREVGKKELAKGPKLKLTL